MEKVKKRQITEEGYTPFLISIIEKLAFKILSLKIRYKPIGADAVREMTGPFIYLAEHHSALDFTALYSIDPDKDMAGVINEHYFRIPVLGSIMKKSGHISKKIFYPDVKCLKGIIRTIKRGRPVVIMPEARLSTDGGPSFVNENIAGLCKKLGVPVVIVEIRNNYFIAPKWRKKLFRGVCEAEVKRIISPDELKELDGKELIRIIRENLSYNEFSRTVSKFRSKNKAKGLEQILYLCPHCRTLYSNVSKGNTLTCTHCGKQYVIDRDYRFTDQNIKTIYDYYAKIKQIEKETLHKTSLDIPVDVKIFKDQVKELREEKGVFHLDDKKVYFRSDISDLYFEYTIDCLEGIAYSVNEEFEMYHNDELYYFYPPKGERTVCTRVALLIELLSGELQHE